jgi:hypothetical protein
VDKEGWALGCDDGALVGDLDGTKDGKSEGVDVGVSLGDGDGAGDSVGVSVGPLDGWEVVGKLLGTSEGASEKLGDWVSDGASDGDGEGTAVSVGAGENVGRQSGAVWLWVPTTLTEKNPRSTITKKANLVVIVKDAMYIAVAMRQLSNRCTTTDTFIKTESDIGRRISEKVVCCCCVDSGV